MRCVPLLSSLSFITVFPRKRLLMICRNNLRLFSRAEPGVLNLRAMLMSGKVSLPLWSCDILNFTYIVFLLFDNHGYQKNQCNGVGNKFYMSYLGSWKPCPLIGLCGLLCVAPRGVYGRGRGRPVSVVPQLFHLCPL